MTSETAVQASDRERREAAVLDRFEAELGALWPRVAPHCIDPGVAPDDTLRSLREQLARQDGAARDLASDLEALIAGWAHYGGCERAILSGALHYLAATEDAAPDGDPGGFADDELVVEAAVRALLRRSV